MGDATHDVTLLARDVMQPHVVTVAPDTTLADLADLLIRNRIGGVPVVDGDAVVGVVSRSDFPRVLSLERSRAAMMADAYGAEEFAPGETPDPIPRLSGATIEGRTVREVMVPAAITVSPTTPIDEVAHVLATNHLHRVLVVDGGTLCGVISALDIVRLVASRQLAAR